MIAIVGGGITGLAAAHELTRRGVPFILFDASDRAGGLIHTEQAGGFTLDAGPDSLLAQKPAAIDLCHELGLGGRLIGTSPPRTAYVLKRGRLYPLPQPSVLGLPATPAALARYDLLSWPARARLALEPFVPRGTRGDESVASFFRRRFGAATVDLIAQPLLGGIHAGHIDQLSVSSLFPSLAEAERLPGKVLRNLPRRKAPDPEGPFRALRGGMAELVEALAGQLPPGAARLGLPVRTLQRPGAGWRIGTAGGPEDAQAVILAAPAHAAAALLRPLDATAAGICSTVAYVSTVSVALGWPRRAVSHPLTGSGFVVARDHNRLRITACTWVSSKWQGRAPDGYVLLRAFLGGAHDPGAVDLEDGQLIEIAVRELASTLGLGGPPSLVRVFRARNAGAQQTVGHAARMAALRERLAGLPGLFVAGSGFEAIGIPDCVRHGRRAAAAAADYVTMGG